MKLPALLLSLAAAAAATLHGAEYEARVFTTDDGAKLNYRLLTPENYDKSKKYPLLVFLHGAGERGDNNSAQLRHGAPLFLKSEVRKKYPCFVFAPQCPNEQTWSAVKGWTEAESFSPEPKAPMKLALAAIDAISKEFSVDGDRLYITGLSMGGYGTWDILSRIPDRIAAAAPVCGGGDASKIAGAKGVAVWAFHGMEDNVVPVARSREMVAALKTAGGKPLYSEYPYVKHNSWSTAYGEPELLAWMFAQKRGSIVPWDKVADRFSQPPVSETAGTGTMQSGLWFRPLWKERREKWAKEAKNDQGAVVFFGDSITQGWGSLENDFAGMKVANRGISGDTTRGLRERVQEDVIAVKPKAVSLLIGTNDLDQGSTPKDAVDNLKAIVAELHKADPKLPIVINKVMPRGAKKGKYPEQIKELNDLYVKAFEGNPRISFCDTWSIFDSGDGQCRKDEFPDMLHPNAAGYKKWVEALKPVLTKAIGK